MTGCGSMQSARAQALPAEASLTTSKSTTFEQNRKNSPLLRLPAELRNKVYEYVFCVPQIDICVKPQSDVSVFTSSSKRSRNRCTQVYYPKDSLSLLETCRQINDEAALLPFSLNMFSGYALAITGLGLDIGRDQLRSIKNIRVMSRHNDAARLPNGEFEVPAARLRLLLHPPRRFPALRRFEVTWPADGLSDEDWGVLKKALEDDLNKLWEEWNLAKGIKITLLRAAES